MEYTEEQLNEELMPGFTLRDHLEAEKWMSENNLKCTAQGIEPIISINLSEDARKDREFAREEKLKEQQEKDKF